MAVVAGHTFIGGICVCGRHWVEIRNATTGDVGQEGLAHIGKLTAGELAEIQQAKAAEDESIALAMTDLART